MKASNITNRGLQREQLRLRRVAIELYDFAKMTGYRPHVVAEALMRLNQEGGTDYSNPVNILRFRELLEIVSQANRPIFPNRKPCG